MRSDADQTNLEMGCCKFNMLVNLSAVHNDKLILVIGNHEQK